MIIKKKLIFFIFGILLIFSLKPILSIETNVNISHSGNIIKSISPWSNFNLTIHNGVFCCDNISSFIEFFPQNGCPGELFRYYFNISDIDEDGFFNKEIDLTDKKEHFLDFGYDYSCYASKLFFNFTKIYSYEEIVDLDVKGPDSISISNFESKDFNHYKRLNFSLNLNSEIDFLFVNISKEEYYSSNNCDLPLNRTSNEFYVSKNFFSELFEKGYVYNISFIPYDHLNNEGESLSKEIHVKDNINPKKVNLKGSFYNKKVILNWTDSIDNIGIDKYLIYRSNDLNSFEKIGLTDKNYYIDKDIDNNYNYSYFIVPKDCSDNLGNRSNIFTTTVHLSNPKLISYNLDYYRDGEILIDFNFSSDDLSLYLLSDDFRKESSLSFKNNSLLIDDYFSQFKDHNISFKSKLFENRSFFDSKFLILDEYGNFEIFKIEGIEPIYHEPSLNVTSLKSGFDFDMNIKSNRELSCSLDLYNSHNKNKELIVYDDLERNKLNFFDSYYLNGSKPLVSFDLLKENNLSKKVNLFLYPLDYNSKVSCVDNYGYKIERKINFTIDNILPIDLIVPNFLSYNSYFLFVSLKEPQSIEISFKNGDSFLFNIENEDISPNSYYNGFFKLDLNSKNYPFQLINFSIIEDGLISHYDSLLIKVNFENNSFKYSYNLSNIKKGITINYFNESCFVYDLFKKETSCYNKTVDIFYSDRNLFSLTPFFIFERYNNGSLIPLIFSLGLLVILSILFYFATFRTDLSNRLLTLFESDNKGIKIDHSKTSKDSFNHIMNNDDSTTKDKKNSKQKIVDKWIERTKKSFNSSTNFKNDKDFKKKGNRKEIKKKKEIKSDEDFIFQDDI
ncbi:MAG: hypothetical protein ACOCRX_04230 [Candidatus Woesearchaeota archaeon]